MILACLHSYGPAIRARLHNHTEAVMSFGGGVAIAYVFLQLFPELDDAHHWFGDHVHMVTMVSFLAFYALEILLTVRWFRRRGTPGHETGADETAASFWFHIGVIWIYTWMVTFTLPEDSADSLVFAIAGSITIGIHLIYKDFAFRRHYEERYQQTARVVLALAPLLGWIAHQAIAPSDDTLDIFIAVLAGVLMQSVFRDELPDVNRVRFRWMLAGVLSFSVLVFLT